MFGRTGQVVLLPSLLLLLHLQTAVSVQQEGKHVESSVAMMDREGEKVNSEMEKRQVDPAAMPKRPATNGLSYGLMRLAKRSNLMRLSKRPNLMRLSKRPNLMRLSKRPNLMRLSKRSDLMRLSKRADLMRLAKKAQLMRLAKRGNLMRLSKKSNLMRLSKRGNLMRLAKKSPNRVEVYIQRGPVYYPTESKRMGLLRLAKRGMPRRTPLDQDLKRSSLLRLAKRAEESDYTMDDDVDIDEEDMDMVLPSLDLGPVEWSQMEDLYNSQLENDDDSSLWPEEDDLQSDEEEEEDENSPWSPQAARDEESNKSDIKRGGLMRLAKKDISDGTSDDFVENLSNDELMDLINSMPQKRLTNLIRLAK